MSWFTLSIGIIKFRLVDSVESTYLAIQKAETYSVWKGFIHHLHIISSHCGTVRSRFKGKFFESGIESCEGVDLSLDTKGS
mgnify:CR=1 FL=1